MPLIQTDDGVRLFVQDLNPSGIETVVFVHGWPFDHRMFEYQTNILPAYGFRCVTFDMRGFGLSGCPWGAYSYTRMAEDINIIADRLKLGHFILAGFSMGGAVAVRYLSRYAGGRVVKLALLSAAVPSFVKRPGYAPGMEVQRLNSMISQLYADRPQAVENFLQLFFASRPSDTLREWLRGISMDASGHGTIQTLELLRDEDLRHELFSIQVPTGIFHGVKDQVCPFAFAQTMHMEIGGSALFPFENSGHAVLYDEREKFNAAFLRFLQE